MQLRATFPLMYTCITMRGGYFLGNLKNHKKGCSPNKPQKIMDLTAKDIKADIKDLKNKIATARKKLKSLPTGYIPYTEHRKRERERCRLLNEVDHLKDVIKIAREGLENYKMDQSPKKEKPTPAPLHSPKQLPLF